MSIKRSYISYKESGLYSKVFADYLDGAPYLSPFFEYSPSLKSFTEAIENQKKYKAPRNILSAVIKNYYSQNCEEKTSESTAKNIRLLENENCFTITTGHQLCLFTGPLYFIYKIITVINLSEKLKKEYPEYDFVPVYWMASEDHDFAEINHASLYGKKIEWTIDKTGGPVGRISVSTLSSAIESLFSIIGDDENAKELKSIILESYGEGEQVPFTTSKNLAQATFSLVNALFGKYGLVIVEPDSAELKKVFAPIMEDELSNKTSYRLVTETNENLKKAGVEPSVHPREINLFFIDENGRNRIEEKAGKYEILNTGKSYSLSELNNILKSNPEQFSPNVVLRPLYQQCILPNLAYTGGPAEVAYWLQYKSVFSYYRIPYPILIPRNSALFIDTAAAQKMQKLGISDKDLFKDTENLIKDYLHRNLDGLNPYQEEIIKLKEIYSSIGNKVNKIDPTLVATVEAELQKQLNALKNLETKLVRVQKQKEETSIAQIRKLKDKFFPGGTLQERTENFIPLYIEYGNEFFESLLKYFDPFDFSIQLLSAPNP